ncbi:hypothetical protein BH23DEI1_BH23DEI1_14610 [soil metagenome]
MTLLALILAISFVGVVVLSLLHAKSLAVPSGILIAEDAEQMRAVRRGHATRAVERDAMLSSTSS